MKCPKCQCDNREDAKFCERCGAKLEITCPVCGKTDSPGRRFCTGCGHDLTAPAPPLDPSKPHSYTPKFLADKILTTRSSIEGQRKLVTVLFADVANFTSLSEKLDPEEVHEIMDGCFRILMDEVHKYEGTINQFTGDGVMALFGAPVAHEDHAQKACYAALAIQSALRTYGSDLRNKFRIGFEMRIGLNSGTVVVGSIGDDLRMDYTAEGDTTNLASRVEGLAEPGTILVTSETFKLTEGLFEFEPLGEKRVKGKDKPVLVYKVLSAKDVHRPRLGRERQIFSEMVGRTAELDRLEQQVLRLINGEGSIVNIIGEAGIGKSRLMAELKRQQTMQRVGLLEGRAISIGKNLSFHPIIDHFEHWAGIRADDLPDVAFTKLERAVMRVCGEQMYEIFPFLATLMGMRLTGRYAERIKSIEGEALEKLILKNVRELLVKLSEVTPLVIVTEDLHWADTSSIEFLEAMFRLAETQRILFVNVFRPGYKDTGDRIANTLTEKLPAFYVEIMLQPLDMRMSESLINNMVKIRKLPHTILDQIVQRSGGNPFFIEEVVRSLVDEGAIVLKKGAFEVTDKIHATVIPHTIHEVLMARIDRLEEPTQNLVKVASVIGRSFFDRVLKDVAEAIQDVDTRVIYLKNAELIRERMRMDELKYVFKHALVQETAYQSILQTRKKALHLRVAESIESIFRERVRDFYGQLAYHYTVGEHWEKAEEYLIKAGEEALRSSAASEAIHFYQEALSLFLKRHGDAADKEKKAMLEKNIAIALYNRGQYTESVPYFGKALSLYDEEPPKNTFMLFLRFTISFVAFLTNLYLPSLRFKKYPQKADNEIISLLYARSTALGVTDPKRMFIEGMYLFRKVGAFDIRKLENGVPYLAGQSPFMSWSGISFKLGRKALESIKDKVDAGDIRALLYYAGAEILHVVMAGDWGKEKEYDESLVDAGAELGEFFWASIYTYWHGYLDLERGHFQSAQEKIVKLSKIADTYDNNYSKVLEYALNTVFLVKCRKYREAMAESEKGVSFGMEIGLAIWSFSIYSMKARIQALFDDITGAEDSLRRASQLRSEINVVPFYVCNFLLSRAVLDLWQATELQSGHDGSKQKAIGSGKKAVAASRKAAPERTEAYRWMGTSCWVNGKSKKALTWWNRSIREGVRLGARLELSRTYFEVGKHLIDPGAKFRGLNGVSAEQYLEKAKNLFEEMDLKWDLDELEKVMLSVDAISTDRMRGP